MSWLDEHGHNLKHKQGAASRILKEMESFLDKRLSKTVREKLEAAITYFRNHKHQMNYALYLRTQSRALPSERTVKHVITTMSIKQFVNLPQNCILEK